MHGNTKDACLVGKDWWRMIHFGAPKSRWDERLMRPSARKGNKRGLSKRHGCIIRYSSLEYIVLLSAAAGAVSLSSDHPSNLIITLLTIADQRAPAEKMEVCWGPGSFPFVIKVSREFVME